MSALEKLLKGEQLTEEEKNSLTTEQIAEVRRKELEAVEGIRAERRRLEEKKTQEEQESVTEFSRKYLEEQTGKAETVVFSQLTDQGLELTEEKKEKIRQMRKKIDSGFVTFENLVNDFRAAAAAVENDQLFKDRKAKMDFEKNAAEFNKGGAGASGAGASGGEGGKNYPPEVWEMVKEAQQRGMTLTPDEALRSLTQGLRRVHN